MPARAYKRLPGRGRQFFNYTSLWEGEDHLLLVQSHVVTESYKRFAFRDIQAVVICKTRSSLVMTIALAALGGLIALPAFFAPIEIGIFCGVIAAGFFLGAVINFLRGPSCRCSLRTAVQTQELPSLNRLRTARKVLLGLQPRIAEAQQAAEPRP